MTATTTPQDGPVPARVDYPAMNFLEVTKSDTADNIFRSLWVPDAHSNLVLVALNAADDTGVDVGPVPAGSILPFAVRKVKASGSSVGKVVGLV
jgi:hypothetical protein